MKILIGGVPFGRNNVGDEAILECVVGLLREAAPGAGLTVSTDDGPATAAKLGVETIELFGFQPPYSRERMARALEEHDVFFWAGATGLSDYPEIPLEMLRIAQEAGRRTVVWAVGMNNELNPAKYRVLPGRRRTLLRALSLGTLGAVDFVRREERRREARARAAVAARLARADLVVVRDPESRAEVLRCGPGPEVVVGADTALRLAPAPLERVKLPAPVRAMLAAPVRRVGFCVSAQREIRNRAGLVGYLDAMVEDGSTNVVFIPMNPLTDSVLMEGLRGEMKRPERAAVVEGRYEPAKILAVAAKMDVLASSRLHLLIFASIVHVPIIGISRGSKVDNFLAPFGLKSAGSVEECDFAKLREQTLHWLGARAEFEAVSRRVRGELMGRLSAAQARLAGVLGKGSAGVRE